MQEAAAASGFLCTLQVCTNIQKENIELLEMCFLRVGEQGMSNIKKEFNWRLGDEGGIVVATRFVNRAE